MLTNKDNTLMLDEKTVRRNRKYLIIKTTAVLAIGVGIYDLTFFLADNQNKFMWMSIITLTGIMVGLLVIVLSLKYDPTCQLPDSNK